MKLKFYLTIAILIFGLSYLGFVQFTKNINNQNEFDRLVNSLINRNKITVLASEKINISEIEILLHNENSEKAISVYDSDSYKKIPQTYGTHIFIVKHKKIIIGTHQQFKTNWWHHHNYSFEIINKNGACKSRLTIYGPDNWVENKPMST